VVDRSRERMHFQAFNIIWRADISIFIVLAAIKEFWYDQRF
jgi:hypothetical protein